MDGDERAGVMSRRVEYLASPELKGRAPGTEGGLLARQYVTEAFAGLALEPAGDDGTYAHAIEAIGGANLLGTIPGHGPNADRYVMIGAHYDHLGEYFGEVHPGADDNASGVAVLLDVARQLTERDNLDRTVLICSFDAEEPPHFYTETMGSLHWVDRPTIDLAKLEAMVCVDVVGHSLGPATISDDIRHSVFVMGAERSGLGPLIDGLGQEGMTTRRLDADVIPPMSDHYAFGRVGIPFLFYNVGRDRHYHTPRDTFEKLDYPKMVALSDHLTEVISNIADGPRLAYDDQAVDDHATLSSLVALGREIGPLHRDADRLMILLAKLEQKLEEGTPLSQGARGGLRSAIVALEQAMA